MKKLLSLLCVCLLVSCKDDPVAPAVNDPNVGPQFSAATFDLGTVYKVECRQLSFWVRNPESEPLTIYELVPKTGYISSNQPHLPIDIAPGDSALIRFSYCPNHKTVLPDQITIKNSSKVPNKFITLTGRIPFKTPAWLFIDTAVMDFGKVYVDWPKEMTKEMNNRGDESMGISLTVDHDMAHLVEPQSVVLGKNDSRLLVVRADPKKSGRSAGTLTLRFDGTDRDTVIPVIVSAVFWRARTEGDFGYQQKAVDAGGNRIGDTRLMSHEVEANITAFGKDSVWKYAHHDDAFYLRYVDGFDPEIYHPGIQIDPARPYELSRPEWYRLQAGRKQSSELLASIDTNANVTIGGNTMNAQVSVTVISSYEGTETVETFERQLRTEKLSIVTRYVYTTQTGTYTRTERRTFNYCWMLGVFTNMNLRVTTDLPNEQNGGFDRWLTGWIAGPFE